MFLASKSHVALLEILVPNDLCLCCHMNFSSFIVPEILCRGNQRMPAQHFAYW